METATKNEITFYQDSDVTVTQARFVTNSKTYAMRNISSVHIFEIIKSKRLPTILIIIGAAMLASESTRVVGLCVFIIGIAVIFTIKNQFAVRISTNSGEVNSIISKDKTYIENIVNALSEAIIHRG